MTDTTQHIITIRDQSTHTATEERKKRIRNREVLQWVKSQTKHIKKGFRPHKPASLAAFTEKVDGVFSSVRVP
jgi:hypothetical protein